MRKIFISFLIGITCFIFVGCNNSSLKLGPKSNHKINNEFVSMSIKEGTFSKKGAIILLKNHTNESYLYGDVYSVEYEKNGSWYSIKPLEGMGFNMIGYTLKSNETKEITMNWVDFYGELPKGNYRILKTVSKEIEKNKNISISTEFMIE